MKSWRELYCKDHHGNTRYWWCDQDGNKYRMCSGIYPDGEVVKSEWTIVYGKNVGKKNETSDTEQATKEVEARYKKQRESGYWDNIKDIDKVAFFEPMLAEKYPDRKDDIDWKKGVWVSPKMDGLRCVITSEGCFSRNGKEFIAFPHIPRELKHWFKNKPTSILDGEIYTHTFANNFNKIISLAKKTKPKPEDIVESEKHLQYHIFDVPRTAMSFSKRWDWLQSSFVEYGFMSDYGASRNKWIKLCNHELVHSEEELEAKLTEYISLGYEGLMVNLPESFYENKRSLGLLKYKKFIDEEVEILDIEEGDGNRSGMFGRAICKRENGVIFEANARGEEEFYKKLLKEKKDVIGKQATLRYQNLTPDGKPRFGVLIEIRDYE